MNKIIELKQKYSITCFIIIIINCDNIEDDNYFNENNLNPDKYTFMSMFINTPDDIRNLIKEYNPTAIKCDI